jgi:hypothetical protein
MRLGSNAHAPKGPKINIQFFIEKTWPKTYIDFFGLALVLQYAIKNFQNTKIPYKMLGKKYGTLLGYTYCFQPSSTIILFYYKDIY